MRISGCLQIPLPSTVWVGQGQFLDEGLVPGDQAVGHRAVHQLACVGEPLRRDFRPVAQEAADPFAVYLVGPACLERIGQSDAQQDVAQLGGVENAGVEQRDKVRQAQ